MLKLINYIQSIYRMFSKMGWQY